MGHDDIVARAEVALVGAALLEPDLVERTGLSPHQFFDPRFQAAWGAVSGRKGAGEAIFRVADVLKSDGTLESVGGLSALSSFTLDAAGEGQIPYLVSVVRRAYMDREYAVALSEQLRRLQSGAHADDLVSGHLDDVDRLRRAGAARSVLTAADIVQHELESIEYELSNPELVPKRLGLPWGLNQVVPGGCPTDKLTIVFGPTGGFKSTVANGMARHFAQTIDDGLIVKFGLEDSAVLEAQKLIAEVGRIPLDRIVNRTLSKPQRAQMRTLGADWLNRLVIVDDVVPTSDEMIRAYRALDNVRAVFYDYIQLIDWEGRDERIAIHRFCVKAQRAAKADQVAHIALSQLREDLMEAADPSNKRPRMQWLFGGSAIKNTSKLVIGVYRPWSYFPDPKDLPRSDALQYAVWARNNPDDWKRLVELVIRKNQLGDINASLPVLVDLETGAIGEFHD